MTRWRGARGLAVGSALATLSRLLKIVTTIYLSSCALPWTEGLTILSWTPGTGVVPEGFTVSLRFSGSPDRSSVENAFSLLEDGEALEGGFEWSDATLTFIPCAPPRQGSAYRLIVGGGARTLSGASLAAPFEARFSTRREEERPRVIEFSPGDGRPLADRSQPLSLRFSEAVARGSLAASLSLRPAMRGTWIPSPDGTVATFRPLEPWNGTEEYVLRVSADLEDASGARMGSPWSARFGLAGTSEPPFLLGVDALGPDGLVVASLSPDVDGDTAVTRNPGWESSWSLALRFSEPVSRATLEPRLALSGGPGLSVRGSEEESARFELDLLGRPAWGALLVLELSPGIEDGRREASVEGAVYRIVADGPGSRPPRLAGLRLPLRPGAAEPSERELRAFASGGTFETLVLGSEAEAYPIGQDAATVMELYLELAPEACLDLSSVMRGLRVAATNGALSVAIDRVAPGGIAWAEPYEPWAGCAVARVELRIRNGIDSGLLTVALEAGLRDDRGNASDEAQAVAVLK